MAATRPKRIRRKPGDPPGRPGRPRNDGMPPGYREEAEERLPKSAPAEASLPPWIEAGSVEAEVFESAGIGLPLEDVAALAGVPLADLKPKGRLNDCVRQGIAWHNKQVARSGYEKARGGAPIPWIFWTKARMRWRETGERETDVKEERKITEVTFTVISADGSKRVVKREARPSEATPDEFSSEPSGVGEAGAAADDGRAVHRD